MDKLIKSKRASIVIALICMLFWGSGFPATKLFYKQMGIIPSDIWNKVFFAGVRFFAAGVIVTLYGIFFNKRKIDWHRVHIPLIFVLGFLQTTLQYSLFYIGLGNTSGIKSSILQSISTFLVVIMAHFLFEDDKFSTRKAVALILGFSGIIVSSITSGFDFSFKLQGEGFLLLTGIASAYGTVLVRKYGVFQNPFLLTAGQQFIGSIALLIIGFIFVESVLPIDLRAILILTYSAFASATAFTLWYMLLQYHKAAEISIYRLFIPIFGAILSSLILGESFTIYLVSGLVLVVLGVFSLSYKRGK